MRNYNIFANILNKYNPKSIIVKNNNKWNKYSSTDILQYTNYAIENLSHLGIGKGDRVAYQGKNSIEWITWNLASQSLGAIWVPMYADQTKDYCQFIIDDCKPKVFIKSDDTHFYKNTINIMHAIQKNYNKKKVIVKNMEKDDLSTLIYTSGTTGNPKGVMLSHYNILSNIIAIENRFNDINYQTTSLNILPWAHIYSLTTELYYNLYKNNTVALSSDKTNFINECKEVSPDVLYVVPKLLELIKHKLEKFDKPVIRIALPYIIKYLLGNNVKYIFIGGSKLDSDTKNFYCQNNIKLCEGYGTSETSPMVSVNHHSSPRNILSVGSILENIHVEIINGEICVSGPNVMKGYWEDPEKTNDVLINHNDKVFYKTGDTGIVKNNFLYYNGRISENYKLSNGKFINVSEVENIIKKHISNNFIVYGDGMDANILIVEKPFNRSTLNIINPSLQKYQYIKDIIEIDDFTKYLTPKMSIKRKKLIQDVINF